MGIKVQVSLFSILRENRFSQAEINLPEGALVDDLLAELDLKQSEVGIVMVNAQSGTFRQTLGQGDRITLIPPIGGG